MATNNKLLQELQNIGLDTKDLVTYLMVVANTCKIIKDVVNNAARVKVPLHQLCEIISGHNYDGELFDVELGDVIMTVKKKPNSNGYIVQEDFSLYIGNDLVDGFTSQDVIQAYNELCK